MENRFSNLTDTLHPGDAQKSPLWNVQGPFENLR